MTEKRHGKGLLFIVTLVLAAGVIKYADIPFAQTVREKAASALSGAANADHVLAVFGGSAMPADTVPAESSGGADDILDRDQTLFPDTVDQTVYPMEFEHTTPTSGTLTSSFGSRLSPITGQPGFHYGLDLAADEGTPITAFADGTVRETGESGYGLYVIVDHADGFATLYAHCSSISAKVGDTVTCGQEIAKVGQTGNAAPAPRAVAQRRSARSRRLSRTVSRIQVRDGFLVLMAALWCADESGVLPIFLLAAAVHECGHLFVIRLSGGTVHALCLTACGAVLRCSLPPSPFSRAAICLAGPATSFALTALANPLGAYRLAGASALLGLFNLLPVPPLDGGMALRHLADGRFTRLLNGIAGVSVLVLLAGGVLLWKSGFGGWLLLVGIMITGSAFRRVRRPRRTACNPHARA